MVNCYANMHSQSYHSFEQKQIAESWNSGSKFKQPEQSLAASRKRHLAKGLRPFEPCKSMTSRKSKTVGIHLNDEEYANVKARADTTAARSLGAYIKATVFDNPVPEQKVIRHTKVADPKLIRQLAWIGNNVNQIARAVNRSRFISQTEAASLYAMLSVIAEEMEALREDAL